MANALRIGMAAGLVAVSAAAWAATDEPKPLDDRCILACQAEFDRGLARCNASSAAGDAATLQACVTRAQYQTQVCRSRCGGAVAGSLECYGRCRGTRQAAVARCRGVEGAGSDGLERCLVAADTAMARCSERCGAPPPATTGSAPLRR
jgi:hypothetical protein